MKSRILIILTFLCLVIFSCSKDDETNKNSEEENETFNNEFSLLNKELKNKLHKDSIYVIDPVIYVAKGGERHGVNMSEERIKSFFYNWDKNSVNPMLLQLGVSFNTSNLKIIYVELPMTDTYTGGPYYDYMTYFTGNRGDKVFDPTFMRRTYKLTDANGKTTGKSTKINQDEFRILMMDEGPTGGYAGGVPHRAVVLNVNGSTRNIIAHEVAHVLGLGHINKEDPKFGADCHNWVMNPIIYDKSVFFDQTETDKVHKVLESYYKNSKNRLTSQVRRVAIGAKGFKAEDLNAAWELYSSSSYKNKNRDLEE